MLANNHHWYHKDDGNFTQEKSEAKIYPTLELAIEEMKWVKSINPIMGRLWINTNPT